MSTQENRNNRIIEAILEKEKTLCPGTVALIGIYGSFQTGDIHPLSDLDLLILINDDRGWKLGTSFIQDDLGIGHDIYCTNWESLREDACFLHPHISKLMDSRIVYCADEKYRTELEMLRDQVRRTLAEPFGENDCRKAENELKEARCCYADAMIADDLNVVRSYAGGTIYFAENAVALLNKTYFRKGVRRRYEELNAMERRPENLCRMIEDILRSADLLNINVTHDDNSVTEGHSFGLVMGDVNKRGINTLAKLDNLSTHLVTELSIEVGERFVHEEDLRVTHDGTADGDTLALAAGQSLRLADQDTG